MRRVYRYLDISEADTKKGQIRCDVNVSIMDSNLDELNPNVEIVKLSLNMNDDTFEKALDELIDKSLIRKKKIKVIQVKMFIKLIMISFLSLHLYLKGTIRPLRVEK